MKTIQYEIATCFGQGPIPRRTELVKHDGVEPFLKEDAEKAFTGKSWSDIYNHLTAVKDQVFSADYHLEEWSILEPGPLNYYLRAYLEYLLDVLQQNEPDGQFVSFLFHELYQAVYVHKRAAFDEAQKKVLRSLADYTNEVIKSNKGIEIERDGIADNIRSFLTELNKNG